MGGIVVKVKATKTVLKAARTMYKKAWAKRVDADEEHAMTRDRNRPLIVVLRIPAGATVIRGNDEASWVSATGNYHNKHRTNKAKVVKLLDLKGNKVEDKVAVSDAKWDFYYTVGETVKPDRFDPDKTVVCGDGIHVFKTFQEAVDYEL